MGHYNMRCNYSEGGFPIIHPDEYLITFKCLKTKNIKVVRPEGDYWPPEGEEWCIVSREHVIPETDTSGLVRITIHDVDFEQERAVVGIFNSPDQKIDKFLIPLSEIPRKEES